MTEQVLHLQQQPTGVLAPVVLAPPAELSIHPAEDSVKVRLNAVRAQLEIIGIDGATLVNYAQRTYLEWVHQPEYLILGEYDQVEGLLHLDKVIDINQAPIGRTPRSNPATYTGVFTHIRDLFSQLPESKMRGYKPGRFSFNVKGGRCEACQGDGIIKIEMHFLPDVYVQCEECKGKRYNRETMEVKYKGRNIAEVLDRSCAEALEVFQSIPPVARKLQTLCEAGLG